MGVELIYSDCKRTLCERHLLQMCKIHIDRYIECKNEGACPKFLKEMAIGIRIKIEALKTLGNNDIY